MVLRRLSYCLVVTLSLAACAGGPGSTALAPPAPVPPADPSSTALTATPRILVPPTPLQCVPYARKVSGLSLRGDAWTWWRAAEGRYPRSAEPAVGAVLVFARTQRLRYGHLAVVSAVLNRREILVEHANWLNRGRIHKATPVRDVSPGNDWSLVRVWYTPGKTYGARAYPVQGFIHAPGPARTAAAGGLPSERAF